LIIIVTFLIAPYISRVLGPEGIGMQSYTTSKQSYFSMIAAMGTVTYGERLEEMIKESTVKSFFEIEIMSISVTMCCTAFQRVNFTLTNCKHTVNMRKKSNVTSTDKGKYWVEVLDFICSMILKCSFDNRKKALFIIFLLVEMPCIIMTLNQTAFMTCP
jgi:hypothetical protein